MHYILKIYHPNKIAAKPHHSLPLINNISNYCNVTDRYLSNLQSKAKGRHPAVTGLKEKDMASYFGLKDNKIAVDLSENKTDNMAAERTKTEEWATPAKESDK